MDPDLPIKEELIANMEVEEGRKTEQKVIII